jgi:NAD(P)-dependent dehydrogenase (short-subunit alcohol dehydrogenase family)
LPNSGPMYAGSGMPTPEGDEGGVSTHYWNKQRNGLETALAFGRAGHKVHATMRNPGQSVELAEAAARERLPIFVSTMDVDSDQSVTHAIAAILEDHGPIDVLVNNAGVEREGSVEELPLAEFRAVMETNYFGAIRCIQALVSKMRQRQSGCIINVTSIASRIASAPLTSYTASKWALEPLSEALAGEMKTFNVRVAIVEPGIIDTAMARRIAGQPGDSVYRQSARFATVFTGALQNPTSPSWSQRRSWKSLRAARGNCATR